MVNHNVSPAEQKKQATKAKGVVKKKICHIA